MKTIYFFTTLYGRTYFSDGTITNSGYCTRLYCGALKKHGHHVQRLLVEDVDDLELIRLYFHYPVDFTADDLNNKTR